MVRRTLFLSTAPDGYVSLALNAPAREITATGDREGVTRVVDSIKQTIAGFEASLKSIKISLPKRQHRLLTGQNADTIMTKSSCGVVVGKADDTSDEVTVWGQPADLPTGLSAVMEQANSQYIHELTLPGPAAFSKQLASYFGKINFDETIKASHPNVEVYLPSADATTVNYVIELVGPKADVDAVIKRISDLLGKLIGSTRDVTVEWLFHRIIVGKYGKKYVCFASCPCQFLTSQSDSSNSTKPTMSQSISLTNLRSPRMSFWFTILRRLTLPSSLMRRRNTWTRLRRRL